MAQIWGSIVIRLYRAIKAAIELNIELGRVELQGDFAHPIEIDRLKKRIRRDRDIQRREIGRSIELFCYTFVKPFVKYKIEEEDY